MSTPNETDAHPDDLAVEHFAQAMREKLRLKREQGYSGWKNPHLTSTEYLAEALVRHIDKGDPVDIGNFAMMLHCRGAGSAEIRAVLGNYQTADYHVANQPRLSGVDAVLFRMIAEELDRARETFPNAIHSTVALMEEVGELAKALLDEPWENVRKEAVQVAVMAIRVAVDGDSSLDGYRTRLGL